MSTTVTMQDLELEHAELLPSRETLTKCGCGREAVAKQGEISWASAARGQSRQRDALYDRSARPRRRR